MSAKVSASKIRIIMMDFNKSVCDSWLKHIQDFNKSQFSTSSNLSWFDIPVEMIIHNGDFQQLSNRPDLGLKPSVPYSGQSDYETFIKKTQTTTTVLSPGNSIGYMGGGFDRALAYLFSEDGKNWRSTEAKVQANLLDQYKGYLTPTNANLIEFKGASFYENSEAWGLLSANSILHIPTMRVPRVIYKGDNLEMYRYVFDTVWELLTTVNKANLKTIKWKDNRHAFIDTIILTGIGTGYGGVPIDIMTKSMIAAITIFSNHSLHRVDKSIYCLKFLKEDYNKLIKEDEITTHVSLEEFDPEGDTIDKLYYTN